MAERAAAPLLPAQRLLLRLEWTVIRRLDGLVAGNTRTLMRGSGIDLADLRDYQPHDDVRHIDWNVTARLNAPYVRVYREDRDMTAWFLLDVSASVDFGPPGQTKRDVLAGFVATLARLIQRQGNRVGAVLHRAADTPDVVLPARASRAQVLHLLHRLMPTAPADRVSSAVSSTVSGTTALAQLLHSAQNLLRRRAAVFVISDFFSTPGWQRPLAQLAQRHDVLAVRLFDPLEARLPDVGLIRLRDPETGDSLVVETQDRQFRQRYAELAAAREAGLRADFARSGVDTLELATDDDLLDSLLRYMQLRGWRRRQSGQPFTGGRYDIPLA